MNRLDVATVVVVVLAIGVEGWALYQLGHDPPEHDGMRVYRAWCYAETGEAGVAFDYMALAWECAGNRSRASYDAWRRREPAPARVNVSNLYERATT